MRPDGGGGAPEPRTAEEMEAIEKLLAALAQLAPALCSSDVLGESPTERASDKGGGTTSGECLVGGEVWCESRSESRLSTAGPPGELGMEGGREVARREARAPAERKASEAEMKAEENLGDDSSSSSEKAADCELAGEVQHELAAARSPARALSPLMKRESPGGEAGGTTSGGAGGIATAGSPAGTAVAPSIAGNVRRAEGPSATSSVLRLPSTVSLAGRSEVKGAAACEGLTGGAQD